MSTKADRAALKRLVDWLEDLDAFADENDRLHEELAVRIQKRIGRRNLRPEQVLRIVNAEFAQANAARLELIEGTIQRGIQSGYEIPVEAANAVINTSSVVGVAIPTIASREASQAAGALMRQRLPFDQLTTVQRLQRRTQTTARQVSQTIGTTLRTGQSARNVAAEVVRAGDIRVEIPQYIERLDAAARSGDPGQLRRTIRREIARLRSSGSLAGQDISRDTRRFIRALERSEGQDIDSALDEWIRRRAKNQAFTIARTEGVRAQHQAAIAAVQDREWAVGMRWMLSGAHPKMDICCAEGTLVTTERGLIPIEQVRVGDRVLTHRGRLRPVLRTMRREHEGPLVVLAHRLPGSSLRQAVAVTPNHPIQADGEWVPAGLVRSGQHGAGHAFPIDVPEHRPAHGTGDTARRGSARNAPAPGEGRGAPAPHDARQGARSNRIHCNFHGAPAPTLERLSASEWQRHDRVLRETYLPPTTGSLHQASARAWPLDAQASGGTASPGSRTTPSRSGGAPGDAGSAGRTPRTSTPAGADSAARSAGGTSTPSSTSSSSPGSSHHTPGTPASPGAPAPSTPSSSSASASSGALRPPHLETAGEGHRIPGIGQLSTVYLDQVAWVKPTRPVAVYNLEVEDDHTYVANGLVTHNCDMYAGRDEYGLGPGGYPKDAVPDLPHPNCTCYLAPIIDEQYDRRELARLRGEPEPPRPWETSGGQDGAAWMAAQPEEVQRQILGPGRLEEFRKRPDEVITENTIYPLYQIRREPPPRAPFSGERATVRRGQQVDRVQRVPPAVGRVVPKPPIAPPPPTPGPTRPPRAPRTRQPRPPARMSPKQLLTHQRAWAKELASGRVPDPPIDTLLFDQGLTRQSRAVKAHVMTAFRGQMDDLGVTLEEVDDFTTIQSELVYRNGRPVIRIGREPSTAALLDARGRLEYAIANGGERALKRDAFGVERAGLVSQAEYMEVTGRLSFNRNKADFLERWPDSAITDDQWRQTTDASIFSEARTRVVERTTQMLKPEVVDARMRARIDLARQRQPAPERLPSGSIRHLGRPRPETPRSLASSRWSYVRDMRDRPDDDVWAQAILRRRAAGLRGGLFDRYELDTSERRAFGQQMNMLDIAVEYDKRIAPGTSAHFDGFNSVRPTIRFSELYPANWETAFHERAHFFDYIESPIGLVERTTSDAEGRVLRDVARHDPLFAEGYLNHMIQYVRAEARKEFLQQGVSGQEADSLSRGSHYPYLLQAVQDMREDGLPFTQSRAWSSLPKRWRNYVDWEEEDWRDATEGG